MKTNLDCIPCFFRQILEGSRLLGASPRQQQKVVAAFARLVPGIERRCSPPEVARLAYGLLRRTCGRADPYARIKDKSNRCALRLLGKLRDKVNHSPDRLLAALELAIAGNIIDFGVKNSLDVKMELRRILERESRAVHDQRTFHYPAFKKKLSAARTLLYLADNAGEAVFDRVLIEEIKRLYPLMRICYAVKDKPVINDALERDARACGISGSAEIVSNGADAPGTVLPLCSARFRQLFRDADMVISKGQGNFESLSRERRPLFFLFMVKCQVVAQESGCCLGTIALLYNGRKGRRR